MTVFLFPGQGSQKVGMGEDLAGTAPGRDRFGQTQGILGYDLLQVCQEGPEDRLRRTLYTQPALYVVSSILSDLLVEQGLRPDAVAGHSAGEYAALYAAGVFDFETGLRIVGRRAQLMEESGEKAGGSMAAVIGLEPEAVEELVQDLASEGIVGVAGYNTDGQTVISGETALVERATEEAKHRGARLAKMLVVSGAFHSELMREASEQFSEFLAAVEFRPPVTSFISNVSGSVEKEPDHIKAGLAQLLVKPVRWTDCLRALAALGSGPLYEVGPGTVLAGLVRKFDRGIEVGGVSSFADIQNLDLN